MFTPIDIIVYVKQPLHRQFQAHWYM